MQTVAEKRLIESLVAYGGQNVGTRLRGLSIGAGKSVVVEGSLSAAGIDVLWDRIDVDDCMMSHPNIHTCYQASVEQMSEVPSGYYDLAFANYVLEHVKDVDAAAAEIHRVLKPGGCFVVSIPNPAAPEFVISRLTPLWFHRWLRGGEGWHTFYSYRNVRDLTLRFTTAGFDVLNLYRNPCIESFLGHVPIISILARGYDGIVTRLGLTGLMGQACAVFSKPEQSPKATVHSEAAEQRL